MDKNHKELLRRNRERLVEDLEALSLLSYLFQEHTLSENDVDLIKAERTRSLQAEKLLDIIPRRGPQAFHNFCRALERGDGQNHLLALLKTPGSAPQGEVSSTNNSFVDSVDGMSSVARHVTVGKSDVATSSAVKNNSKLPQTTEDFIYPMKEQPHGWCLIINNVDFEYHTRRGGSDIDAKQLKELFTKLQYKVQEHRNQTAAELKNTVLQFSKMSGHKEADSMVFCLLSHGLEGQVYGCDGELVSISDLVAMFNGYEAKDLIGKPKMIFIQACRGVEYDHGADLEVTDNGFVSKINKVHVTPTNAEILKAAFPHDQAETLVEPETIPAEADMLVAYSTVPGYVSWSHLQKGSWFVQALVDVFGSYAKREDVVSMLVRVNGKVANEFESYNRKKQIPAPVVMLTKKVFFFPQS